MENIWLAFGLITDLEAQAIGLYLHGVFVALAFLGFKKIRKMAREFNNESNKNTGFHSPFQSKQDL